MKQVGQIIDLFGKAPTTESVQQLLSAGDLVKAMLAVGDLQHVDRKAFQTLIAKPAPALPEPTISKPYAISVDRTMTTEQMVQAGQFDGYVNPNITTEHFPVEEGETELEVVLVGFDHYIESEEAIAMMDPLGFRPAVMPEGLAFAAQHPELQRSNPIVILGSVWSHPVGYRPVGYLGSDQGERYLDLSRFGSRWRPLYRFLFVRK
jgi:hypothetical protein